MIVLTNPIQVPSVLGGTDKINYEKLTLIAFAYDGVTQLITGTCRLSSTTAPGSQNINGTFSFPFSGSVYQVSFPSISFSATITLSSDQAAQIATWAATCQNLVEQGLIFLGVVAGQQSPGF